MTKRIMSMDLLVKLQPLTQQGLISSQRAKAIADSYCRDDVTPIRELINDPMLPMSVSPFLEDLRQFCN